MAKRFVRARPLGDRLSELSERLDSGEIESIEPFGRSMKKALRKARFDSARGEAVWIEEDYCSPPLAMEREAILDAYFEELTVVEEDVDEAAAWRRIEDLPGLWERFSEKE